MSTDWIVTIKAELADIPWASDTQLALIAEKIRGGNAAHASRITDSQVMECILFAASARLNPLNGEITFTARGSRHNDQITLIPIVTIKGMLCVAHRTGECTGIEPTAHYQKGKLIGAQVTVGRNGHDFIGKKYGVVVPKAKSADYTEAEATINAALRIALRLAFPEYLGAVYDQEDFPSMQTPEQGNGNGELLPLKERVETVFPDGADTQPQAIDKEARSAAV